MKGDEPNRLKPLSLWPLSPDEAIRRALNTPPMANVAPANGVHRKPAKARKPSKAKKRK